ncbi:MAG: Alpha-amylase precursor [Tenericutes bacterium ADurb.Bin239]|nr:MAG: Alpha-amylase precursor [Tenericutes bacterium ADurb.Bin239]
MKANKSIRALFLLIPLLIMASCNNLPSDTSGVSSDNMTTPSDYEIDETVTNENGGVYYQIFVRSFADSNGDGYGDLTGIAHKLPYLKTLGVKGIWLTPIHPSPSYHGYDVTDYKAINPDFGTISDFENMISAATANSIDVIIDLVINHSARSHPWFREGRERFASPDYDPNDPYDKGNWYDFYIENGQVKVQTGFFGDSMPELKLDNIAVREEIVSISKFWLDKGVKGFRLDATSHFFESHALNIDFLRWFSNMVKTYKPGSYIVAEAWEGFNIQKNYYAGVDSLFNFDGSGATGFIIDNIETRSGPIISNNIARCFNEAYAINENALMAMFLSNHDQDRSSGMFTRDYLERQKVAASIYILTPGVPFMYYGEEIGLKGSRAGANTDANRRLPMVWKRLKDTYRPNPPIGTTYDMTKQVRDGVEEQLADPMGLLNHYRKVINVRNMHPWIKSARPNHLQLNVNGLTALTLHEHNGNKELIVVHNLLAEPIHVKLTRFITEYEVEIIHDIYATGTRATYNNGTLTLAPYSSVVLRRK